MIKSRVWDSSQWAHDVKWHRINVDATSFWHQMSTGMVIFELGTDAVSCNIYPLIKEWISFWGFFRCANADGSLSGEECGDRPLHIDKIQNSEMF